MIKVVSTQDAPAAIGPYSQAIRMDNLIFTSGQIPLCANGDFINGDIRAQTRQVLENLSAVLNSAHSGLECVIKTTVFLADMDDFGAMNEVYENYFRPNKPARSTICVKKLPRDALVEIECIAYVK